MTEPSSPSKSDLTLAGLPIALGETIGGKYRIDKVLGAGGMGLVLAGYHLALGQRVAIKVLKPNALAKPEFVARFAREARAAAKLRTEHVARVIDVGHMDGNGSNDGPKAVVPFIVMEYLHGQDLSQLVKAKGPLSVADAADLILQACEALAEAHRAGIIHRDLKPANLFLTKGTDGSPLLKVLDFGISKIMKPIDDAGPSEGLTETEIMMGSPYYMSPEQLKSARTVDARTDIWLLGSVLFKILTGESAFLGDSTPELCVSILVGSPRNMCELRPDLPPEIEVVVRKCLEKDPAARYQTVSDLADALAPFAPPQSQPSIAIISRVTRSADPLQAPPSVPPPNAADALSSSKSKSRKSSGGGGDDAPNNINGSTRATTMTDSEGGGPASPESTLLQHTQSVHIPMSSSRRPWLIALVATVAVVGAGIVAIQRSSSTPSASSPTTPAEQPSSSTPAVTSNAAPTTSTPSDVPVIVTADAAATTTATTTLAAARTSTNPAPIMRAPAATTSPLARPRSSASAAAVSTAATTTTAPAGAPVPDFGGRK